MNEKKKAATTKKKAATTKKKNRQKNDVVPIHDVHYERFGLMTASMSGVSRILIHGVGWVFHSPTSRLTSHGYYLMMHRHV
jgi:hypothetical protein